MKVALIANTDWYLYSYRLSLATELKTRGESVTLISPPGKYIKFFNQKGLTWKSIRVFRSSLYIFNEILTFWDLLRLYKAENYDVVHHFTIKLVLYGSIAAKITGIKRIVNSITGRGYFFSSDAFFVRFLRKIAIGILRRALKNSTVVFQNHEDRGYFLGLGIVESVQCALIKGSGVDTEKFAFLDEPSGKPRVILVARLLWSKGVREFAEAAHWLIKKNVEATFQLIGARDQDNPDAIPQTQINDWIKDGVIEEVGWVDDMVNVYRNCHIVCLPSYGEGLPKTLLEAAAVGRPIVATDVPGCREVVKDGENGFLVPQKDWFALAKALEKLIQDPSLRTHMGKRGRKIIEENFKNQFIDRLTINLYRS